MKPEDGVSNLTKKQYFEDSPAIEIAKIADLDKLKKTPIPGIAFNWISNVKRGSG